jgi:Tc toxin complex TcA C-terminal TcB-binding domain/Neuraminidase-like domain/Salmonella virulence plasmid 28.1kDa A protein
MDTKKATDAVVGGTISDLHERLLAGLIVRAYARDRKSGQERLLGAEAVTDVRGRYTIRFLQHAEAEVTELLIRVGEGKRALGESPAVPAQPSPIEIDLSIDYVVDDPQEPARTVFGIVRDARGKPLAKMTVRAVDRDFRAEQPLGQDETDIEGAYEIEYFARQFQRSEKGSADLVVQVLDASGASLAAAPALFNAPTSAEVNITVPAESLFPGDLFERIASALTPILQGFKVADIEEDDAHQDLSFLVGETGLEMALLARFVLAHRIDAADLRPEFWFVLLGGSFFEYAEKRSLSVQLAAVLQDMSSLDAMAVRKSLARGFAGHEITEKFKEAEAQWVEALLRFNARDSASASRRPTFVAAALDDAGIKSPERRLAFARLFNEHKALTPELIDALGKAQAFTPAEVADLRTSYELAELTRADISVVRMLKAELAAPNPERIRTLAKRSRQEWAQLVEKKHQAGEIELPVEMKEIPERDGIPQADVFAGMLERRFHDAFPTTAFAGGLERALANGGARGLRRPELLRRLMDRHDDFDLLTTSVDEFLDKGLDADSAELAKDEAFRRELKGVQRVFKLAPNFEATDTLLAGGLHSSQQIYRLGEREFVKGFEARAGFTPVTARLAWSRAAGTHAAVLSVVGDLKALDDEALPMALKNGNAALETFPNWKNLFKGGDLCECESCRSVLSPAAYFSDLLMFLKDRPAANPARSVKDILFDRRPDLGYLELNCENALTTLPYIDVVCEVLEDVVGAGENDLELPGFAAMPAGEAAARAAVLAALDAQGITLGESFSLSQVVPTDPDRWVVHGSAATYLLKKKATPNFFAELLRNTKASADELRAYPQYVNPKAYEKLRAAKYPLGLPFDLFAEEVRAAFLKANLKRWDLMQTLRGAAPANPTDGDIAAEYFGISTDAATPFDEKRLILTADASVAGQQVLWGESGAAWLSDVGNVKAFLGKTGLDYNEMLALLDLKFIDPAEDIEIHHLDASCDTDQKVIETLDAVKLDRIHRFLRLWRRLGSWKMWELDLVVRHPRIGNGAIDETFLIALVYFCRLKERLGKKATVEQVAALFGDLNTESRFTKLHATREVGLYQKLFLNRRLLQPLDPAFEIDAGTGDVAVGETMTAHQPAILAALGLRDADLTLFRQLTKASDGLPYIADSLTLSNLSFVWRHAWVAKVLSFKAEDWKTVLKLFKQDVAHFSSPPALWAFIENLDHFKATGFSVDSTNWLLAADLSAKAAVKETDASRFLAALRKELQSIRDDNDPARYPFLTVVPATDADAITALLTALLLRLNRDDPAAQFVVATLRDEVAQEQGGTGLPAAFVFPAAITGPPHNIRIRFDDPVLRFTGVMTSAERATLLTDPSLAAVTGIPAYQAAIAALFDTPRLALKFFVPDFAAPLAALPTAVDFAALPDAALARKISYDAERRQLLVRGILGAADQAALDALSADAAYRNAVNSLVTQPALVAAPDARIWLLDTDLKFPLRDLDVPSNDHLAENLALATSRLLSHLSKTLAEQSVIEQCAAQLGLTEAATERLLTKYARLPATLLAHLTGPFAATSGVVDYATLSATFDAWYWAHRCAAILKKWKITLEDWERLAALTAGGQLLDFLALPLNLAGASAPVDRFTRMSRLVRIRDVLPEARKTFFEVLAKLASGGYATPAAFAADVEAAAETWPAADVEALVPGLGLAYPADFLLAETWERLRRAFSFLAALNAGAATAMTFAATAMTLAHAKRVNELLRARFGADAWLALCAEIQDVLRERKRDALTAFLLTQAQPADAPSGKWENTNDLYAYYLLDVEMCSCQLTSRLVHGSGSIQLFVQRCFMGLEPKVEVDADGPDGGSAWRWWAWMRKYRVWEANRKVFLWPENWIEPELKKDRSPFFKDLENELLQNDISSLTVETAFSNYLEKLRGVAQLEIAGFFQEDDGDNTIVHLFGRTPGAEPHLYYYRRFDYRQWTPWEKVELDIEGNYLVPAVVGTRLFLLWPIFTEIPDEESNNTVTVPKVDLDKESSFAVKKAHKRLRLQMAVSDYRQGKWTPKRVSTDFLESGPYNVEIVRKHYVFYPIDRSEIDGRFGVKCEGWSASGTGSSYIAGLFGTFEVAGCKGVPELTDMPGYFKPAIRPESPSVGNNTNFLKWAEIGPYPARDDAPENDFTLVNSFSTQSDALRFTPVLMQTPWLFKMTPPWHLSYLDRMMLDGLVGLGRDDNDSFYAAVGSWLPYFYNDKKRTFFVLPSFAAPAKGRKDQLAAAGATGRLYYPEIKAGFRKWDNFLEGQVRTWLDGFDLTTLTSAQRNSLDAFLWQAFPEQAAAPLPGGMPPPYAPEEEKVVKELLTRWYMRFFHFFLGVWGLSMYQFRQFHFKNHYHPFVCDFAKLVYNPLKGIPALMSRPTQLKNSGFDFARTYQPTPWVVDPGTNEFYPQEVVDFKPDGAYAPYNWELFFHAPLLIANALSRDQRFEEARQWYHYIFNPIGLASAVPGGSPMSKYWITKPFFETTDPQYVQQRIDNILRMLAGDTSVPGYSADARTALEAQVIDWRTNPFEPHRIANYRTVAYQKTVVMKYLDNLVAWGDNLFRQDSMESTNEATQLYILAAEILGPRPLKVPPRAVPPLESFNELEFEFDAFSNALIDVENLVPPLPFDMPGGADPAPLPMLYFCIPHNEKMLGYWDTVADRLYKLRHCMNIEGVVRQLALFEPPIDPAALVKAVAGGADIASALADLNAPLPFYRFGSMLQRANEVCSDVKVLGAALLGALEKKDAEALARLRQDQEIRLLDAAKAVRQKQIDEAKENLNGVQKNKELVTIRRDFYRNVEKVNAGERLHQDKLEEALKAQQISQIINIAASVAHIVPTFDLGVAGFGGSPKAAIMFGGPNVGSALQAAAGGFTFWANVENYNANKASINAGHDRRWDDWKHQEALADKEIEQMDRSIAAAELRVAIAEKELENHDLQIENAKGTDAFMRSKYTNQELYQWQVGQISGVYFKSYRLAYDLAKRAERCCRFELGLQDSSYINFGYWDSLKKGLLSGDALQYDLRRLEAAYLDQNRREFELTKHVSLTLIDPLALVMLRETGRCFVRMREEMFDLDFPGHYFRRIKSVTLTLPCVVGPYTTISATLRLMKNSIRINTASGDNGYPRNADDDGLPADDGRFIENNIPIKAVAVSSAQNDSGMFELNFRDERYLPFEGAGAVSDWSVELFTDLPANNPDPAHPDFGRPLRQFDYATISDAILQVKYTAREDAGAFKNGVIGHLRGFFEDDGRSPSVRLFDLRRDFPSQWHRFLHPTVVADGNVIEIAMARDLFPVLDQGKTIKVNSITLLARCSDAGTYAMRAAPPLPAPPPAGSDVMPLTRLNQYGGLHVGQRAVDALAIELPLTGTPITWKLRMTRPGGGDLQVDPGTNSIEVEDVLLILGYQWE